MKNYRKALDKNFIKRNALTAQHSTAQHSTAQHSTAQHSTAQHSTVSDYYAFLACLIGKVRKSEYFIRDG